MSEKRVVLKSVQINIFSTGECGLNVSPGTTTAEAAAILHGALGVAMREMAKESVEGREKQHLVVVPGGTVPKAKVV